MELVKHNTTYLPNYNICDICENHLHSDYDENMEITCDKCGNKKKKITQSVERTIFFSLTALILYIPANLLPFMTFEMHGNRTEATIWSGIVTLAKDGSYFLALIVFLASMIVPFVKLLALFYLSLYPNSESNRKFKTKLFKFIETIGPWSMLDIFLVAVFVAIVKFDAMANVQAGPGSAMFLMVVIFSMMASKNFNSKMIWDENERQ